ncbi:MAG: galactokinase [Phycisphaeraceae bacterium]
MPDHDSEPLRQPLRDAVAEFRTRFGRAPAYAAAAPGRVNLIGEHTDYNDGLVLPMAIARYTVIVGARTDDGMARLASLTQNDEALFAVSPDLRPGEPRWANYVKGVVAGLIGDFGRHFPAGFEAVIASTVPLGGGLSSSAALEVAAATLLEAMSGQTLDPVEKALLAQKAEHEFAGMPCGIMDQFISTMAREGHAMLLDCRSHETRFVPLSDPAVSVLIANTNCKHELTGGEYAQRRAQCEEAARTLGAKALRDVTMKDLAARKEALTPLAYRRAAHVVSEIARTLQAADDMAGGKWESVGQLMYQSHQSLRDDFEVSTPELDTMVDLARDLGITGGVWGARMTGGGFGGCTVTLVKTDQAQAVSDHLARQYQQKTGIEPTLFVTRPAGGARVVKLPNGCTSSRDF